MITFNLITINNSHISKYIVWTIQCFWDQWNSFYVAVKVNNIFSDCFGRLLWIFLQSCHFIREITIERVTGFLRHCSGISSGAISTESDSTVWYTSYSDISRGSMRLYSYKCDSYYESFIGRKIAEKNGELNTKYYVVIRK